MKSFKLFAEEMTFKVEVEGLPAMYVNGNSPGQVKNHLRKLVKQPSMIKSVKRQTKHDVKKMYRDKAQGKEVEEGTVDYGTDKSIQIMKKKTPGETTEKLTIGKIRRAAYKTGKALGDVQAVKKNKVARRVKNRIVGKLAAKALSGLFK